MKVGLECKKRKVDGKYEVFTEWDIKGIDNKKDLSKVQKELSLAHKYREVKTAKGESVYYLCNCDSYNNIEMIIVKNNHKYNLRNIDGELHNYECPFFTLRKNYNEDGRQIALSYSMFKLPRANVIRETESTKIRTPFSIVSRVNKKCTTTFNGLMYSILDSSNISMNRHNNYSETNVCKQVLGRFLNIPYGVEDPIPFSEFRKNLGEGNSISIDVGFIYEEDLKLRKVRWDNKAKKYIDVVENNKYVNHVLNTNFIDKIESKKYKFVNTLTSYDKGKFKSSSYPIIHPLVMRETLNSIRNYDNITQGEFLFLKLSTKLTKKEKYKSVVQFFLQPIYRSKKYVLPVESNFERDCIQYIDEHYEDIELYKPMTRDRKLFFDNLTKYLSEYSEYMDIYKQACNYYDDKKVIRPDLFMIKNDTLYIFEFVGYPNDEFYMNSLKKKRDNFYCYFDHDNMIYIEVKIDSMQQDFIDNGL